MQQHKKSPRPKVPAEAILCVAARMYDARRFPSIKKETSRMKNDKPPSNSQRVHRVADLPPERGPTTYVIVNNDEDPKTMTLQKRKRQIMDLLLQGPVYCASPVRISDIIHILKREIGLDVETKFYAGDKATGSGDYGVYFLKSRVHRSQPQQVAA